MDSVTYGIPMAISPFESPSGVFQIAATASAGEVPAPARSSVHLRCAGLRPRAV